MKRWLLLLALFSRYIPIAAEVFLASASRPSYRIRQMTAHWQKNN